MPKLQILPAGVLILTGLGFTTPAAAGPLSAIGAWLGGSAACIAGAASLGVATGPGAPLAVPAFYAICISGAAATTAALGLAPIP